MTYKLGTQCLNKKNQSNEQKDFVSIGKVRSFAAS